MSSIAVTLIAGDGVGPEVARSAVRVIEAADVPIAWEEAEAGGEVFRRGDSSGVPRETMESIARTRVVLKGPLETPVGFGEKSANVTLRKLFETYANVRPARELPGVPTRYAGEGIDLVVVRENLEDLYAGIEYLLAPEVAFGMKYISRRGSEKIIRYAFELARREGRAKVTCATKANIMKLTEGLFKRTFEEIAPEYPEITADHLIVDNAAHQLAKDPAQFDVIVTTNLNGDILSDLASGLVGGLGFASSGNYGDGVAIFEAVHGSAPKYAGKDVINPTALILSAVLMLRHIGRSDAAGRIEDAVLVTLEEGHAVTQDLAKQSGDVERATSTTGYTDAIISNLGRSPSSVPSRSATPPQHPPQARPRWTYDPDRAASVDRRTVGVDVYLESSLAPQDLGRELEALSTEQLELKLISSRGTMVYPGPGASVDHVGQFRCRFVARGDTEPDDAALRVLQERIAGRFPHWSTIQKLQTFEGQDGFTKAQGQ